MNFIFTCIILITKSMAEDDKYEEIIGYSLSNAPEYPDFNYYYDFSDIIDKELINNYIDDSEEIGLDLFLYTDIYDRIEYNQEKAKEQYEIEKEEFYRLQKLEIKEAKKQVFREVSYKYYIYIALVIIGFGSLFFFLTKSVFENMKRKKNNDYMVCEAVCIDKGADSYSYKNRYHFYIVAKLPDGIEKKIFVLKDTFDLMKLGEKVLLSCYSEQDECYSAYPDVR